MSFVENSILFSKNLHSFIKGHPFTVCDIGARGSLIEPWNSLLEINQDAIKVLGFEPDKDECSKLEKQYKKNSYFPFPLWNKESEISLNIAKNPSTSSVHPPNFDLLKNYNREQLEPRITDKVLKLKARTLDDVIKKESFDVDFIKIDTQGSEFEIIDGGKKTLQNQSFGCVLETWPVEIHKDQFLSFDIMKFMHNIGYVFFDLQVGARWKRKFASKHLKSKGQVVVISFLYFKSPENFFDSNPSAEKTAKAVAISDVWGFPDYAIQLIDSFEKKFSDTRLNSFKSEIIKRRTKNISKRGMDKIKLKFLSDKPPYPNIH